MQRGRFRRVDVEAHRIVGHVGHQREPAIATPHRPSTQVEVENGGFTRNSGGATQTLVVAETLARVVRDREMGDIPFQVAVPSAKDDVLESVAIALLREEMPGEVPPLHVGVMRSVITRKLNRDWRIGRDRSSLQLDARGGRRRERDHQQARQRASH